MDTSFVIALLLSPVFRSSWIVTFLLLILSLYEGRPPANEFVQQASNDLICIAESVQNWESRK